jgi:hypothetical protein
VSKFPTYPTLYDECLQISIYFLRKHEYLNPSQWKSGMITWSRGEGENKQVTAQINISVSTHSESPYLELNYNYNGKPINYRVQLVSVPSNLLKGNIWFFICPHTGKRCRKLYCAGERFLHREAFRGCMYEKQTQSKKSRYLDKTLGVYFRSDELFGQLYKKHFKKQYAGKPTKKYLKLTQQIQRAESITAYELEKLFLS